MTKSGKKTRPLFYVLAVTMTLGPLAALVIGSQVADPEPVVDAGGDAASIEAEGLAAYDDTRRPVPHARGTDIVDVVRASGAYETFYAAVRSAGLADELATGGPYTVFVPTQDAFEREAARSGAASPGDGAALRELVRSHIVAGRVSATDLMREDALTALNGKSITLTARGDVRANGASVLTTQVAENGVIHVVDAVL